MNLYYRISPSICVIATKEDAVDFALQAHSGPLSVSISIRFDEWPAIRDAVDKALAEKAEK